MKKCKNITCWTDYPVTALGDIAGQKAPVRRVKVVSYDNNKYANIIVIDTSIELEVKIGYLYNKPMRLPSCLSIPWQGYKRFNKYYKRFSINPHKLERMAKCK